MKDEFWHVRSDFLTSDPHQIVKDTFNDDKKNYARAELELSKDVSLLDDALALFITSLQGGYRKSKNWKDNDSVKAAVAMANSALNYLLLARHSILLGYFAEARNLLRGCHERITRCYLFYADVDEARKFLTGKKLCNGSEQSYVDHKIANILKDKESLSALREMYDSQSSHVHPNLESLRVRTDGPETEELCDRVVKYPIFGGMLNPDLGKAYLFAVFQSALFALSVIKVIFVETSGHWDNEFRRIWKIHQSIIEEHKTAQPQATEET